MAPVGTFFPTAGPDHPEGGSKCLCHFHRDKSWAGKWPNPSGLSWAQLFIWEAGESDHGTVCSEGYQAHGNSQGVDASEEEPWAQLFRKPASLPLQPHKPGKLCSRQCVGEPSAELHRVGFIRSGKGRSNTDWEDPSSLPDSELLPMQLWSVGRGGPGRSVPVVNPNERHGRFPRFLPLDCFFLEL